MLCMLLNRSPPMVRPAPISQLQLFHAAGLLQGRNVASSRGEGNLSAGRVTGLNMRIGLPLYLIQAFRPRSSFSADPGDIIPLDLTEKAASSNHFTSVPSLLIVRNFFNKVWAGCVQTALRVTLISENAPRL
jgi:hypothetical protein